MKILIIHGPNLNFLGIRETKKYGYFSLKKINTYLMKKSKNMKIILNIVQSNNEYKIIKFIHTSYKKKDFLIINPAGFTHTSISIRDALLCVKIPFIEVHISNIYKREKFRHHSYFSDIAIGVISGLGYYGYLLALKSAKKYLNNKNLYKI